MTWVTVVLAVGISGWSLLDQALRLAGQAPPWGDPDGPQGLIWRAFVIFGALALVTLAVSLHAAMPTLPIGRVGRAAGRILTGSYLTLAGVYALNALTGLSDGGIGRGYQIIGGAAFVVMFLSAVPLGATLLHHGVHRGAGVLLLSAVPTILVTAAVGAATDLAFAHPAIGESVIYLATALLAVRRPGGRTDPGRLVIGADRRGSVSPAGPHRPRAGPPEPHTP
ncbi:hypothetical protein ACVBEQ_05170 [Nakamurella sp. GG22]